MNRAIEITRSLFGLDDHEVSGDGLGRIRVRIGTGAVIIAALSVIVLAVGIAFVTNTQQKNNLPTELRASANPVEKQQISVAAPQLTVHLSGGVAIPGIYSLPAGSRVIDAIMAAGGLQSETDDCGVNLAREVRDGEQIVLGAQCGADSSSSTSLVSLNGASGEQLDSLPGIGPTLAQRIISWRDMNGGFVAVEQLNDVPGIGDKLYAGVVELVTL